MNKEELRAAAAVMLAAAEGRKIQCRLRGPTPDAWEDIDDDGTMWDTYNLEYRIAPEPREWWITFHKGSRPKPDVSGSPNKTGCSECGDPEIVHVREVVSE